MTALTRRQFVAAAGTGSALALAGCFGEPPGADLDDLDPDTQPMLGQADAPVTVTVFVDYACPHCRTFEADVVPSLRQNHVQSGAVRLFHADFPLPVDQQWSYAVPNAARAVYEEAGNAAFWDFTAQIFTHQQSYSYSLLADVADQVAGVGQAARTAAEGEAYSDAIDADHEMGESWSVNSTPSVFVGEQSVDSDYPSIRDAIANQQ